VTNSDFGLITNFEPSSDFELITNFVVTILSQFKTRNFVQFRANFKLEIL